MGKTYFEHQGSYANAMFVSADVTSDGVSIRFHAPRFVGRFFGLADRSISLGDVEAVEFFRHPISRVHRARVVAGGEEYVLSNWVGEEILRHVPQRAVPDSS